MIQKISSIMFSAAAGISQMVVIHALGNFIGLFEEKTELFKNVNSMIFISAVLVLLGLSYFFMKLVVANKFSYFLGALLLEIVFFIIVTVCDESILSANALSFITVYLTYAFIPILILDALILMINAVVKAAKDNKAEKKQNKEEQTENVQQPAVKGKKNYYYLVVAVVVAVLMTLSYNLLSGIEFMMLLPLPGIFYFYFQTKCEKQWIYTLTFVGVSVLGVVAALIFLSNPFLLNEGVMSISAAVTVLIIDIIALIVKKRLKN